MDDWPKSPLHPSWVKTSTRLITAATFWFQPTLLVAAVGNDRIKLPEITILMKPEAV